MDDGWLIDAWLMVPPGCAVAVSTLLSFDNEEIWGLSVQALYNLTSVPQVGGPKTKHVLPWRFVLLMV